MRSEILEGDALAVLGTMLPGSVQCVITSPPYWGLRDYGVEGQIGLEETPDAYVQKLVELFREVRRILRPDGTLWLNLGDSYTSGNRKSRDPGQSKMHEPLRAFDGCRPGTPAGLKPKDLVGIPWRVAFALQADGWWLRSDIVWAKPNPMPESVTDRPTRAHEYVFLLTKSERYFYDADAIREPLAESTRREIDAGYSGSATKDYAGNGVQDPSAVKARIIHGRRRRRAKTAGPGSHAGGRRQAPEPGEPGAFHPLGANRRTVWWIPTHAFPEAHFATFPPALVEPCVKAGTSERGACATCGAPWERETRETDSWRPSCTCAGDFVPCLVLDPFCGSGTVGVVANLLGRSFVGIELKPEYAAMARRRLRRDGAPLFTQEQEPE